MLRSEERSSDDERAWELSKPRLFERGAARLLAGLLLGALIGATLAYFLAS